MTRPSLLSWQAMDCGRLVSILWKFHTSSSDIFNWALWLENNIFLLCLSLSNQKFNLQFQVMSNEEAVESIRQIKDAHAAAKHLTEEALKRKSKDDISCIVVRFHWFHFGFLVLSQQLNNGRTQKNQFQSSLFFFDVWESQINLVVDFS